MYRASHLPPWGYDFSSLRSWVIRVPIVDGRAVAVQFFERIARLGSAATLHDETLLLRHGSPLNGAPFVRVIPRVAAAALVLGDGARSATE